jgi:SAM-dependent methyltransferase
LSLEKYKLVIHEDFSKHADFIDKTIKELKLNRNSKILDIGTGFGAMSILLAINGFNVITGQPEEDLNREEHDDHHFNPHENSHNTHQEYGSFNFNWRENAKQLDVEEKIKFQFLNAENLPFSNDSFDGIFMYDTLQHISNRELALNESIRVMKSEGSIVVIEWNEKAIEEDYKKYGYKIDLIDPSKILNRDDIEIQIFRGKLLNIYIIRKIK